VRHIALTSLALTCLAAGSPARAAPLWLGPWSVEAPATFLVGAPPSPLPGATLAITPAGKAPITGALLATVVLLDDRFGAASLRVLGAFDPSRVQVRVLLDGDPVAALVPASLPDSLSLTAPDEKGAKTLTLELVAKEAPPSGWSVAVEGVTFEVGSWRLLYSPDASGWAPRVFGDDHVRIGVDPDWAELGWKLAGSVALTRAIDGGAGPVRLAYEQVFPDAGLLARLGADGSPWTVFAPGVIASTALEFEPGGARRLELSARAQPALKAKVEWFCDVSALALGGGTGESLPGHPTATGPGAGGGASESGCSARRDGGSLWLLGLCAGIASMLTCTRRRPGVRA